MTYIKEIIFTSIICGIVTGMAALGKSSSTKYVKFAASLAFLCVLVSPLFDGSASFEKLESDIRELTDITNTTDDSDDYANSLDIISREICKAAVKKASEDLGLSPDNISMSLVLFNDSEKYSIKECEIYIAAETEKINVTELENYFTRLLSCNVEVHSNG